MSGCRSNKQIVDYSSRVSVTTIFLSSRSTARFVPLFKAKQTEPQSHMLKQNAALFLPNAMKRQRQRSGQRIVSSGRSLVGGLGVGRSPEECLVDCCSCSCRARELLREEACRPFILWFLFPSSSSSPFFLPSILCKHEKRSVQTQVKRQDVTKDCSSSSLPRLETSLSLLMRVASGIERDGRVECKGSSPSPSSLSALTKAGHRSLCRLRGWPMEQAATGSLIWAQRNLPLLVLMAGRLLPLMRQSSHSKAANDSPKLTPLSGYECSISCGGRRRSVHNRTRGRLVKGGSCREHAVVAAANILMIMRASNCNFNCYRDLPFEWRQRSCEAGAFLSRRQTKQSAQEVSRRISLLLESLLPTSSQVLFPVSRRTAALVKSSRESETIF